MHPFSLPNGIQPSALMSPRLKRLHVLPGSNLGTRKKLMPFSPSCIFRWAGHQPEQFFASRVVSGERLHQMLGPEKDQGGSGVRSLFRVTGAGNFYGVQALGYLA
jgi:hypothetical protein